MKEITFNSLHETVQTILEQLQVLNLKMEDNQLSTEKSKPCPDIRFFPFIDHAPLEDWIDGQIVMQILHISPRTLQTLRSNGTLPFSRIGNKIYYKRSHMQRILRDNYTMNKIRKHGNKK